MQWDLLAEVIPYGQTRSRPRSRLEEFGGIVNRTATLAGLTLALTPLPACAQVPEPAHQIASSVQAAPEALREGATVLGYNGDGDVEVLREGTNHLNCLADNPSDDSFSVACYHKDLEPFMARGRELSRQGYEGKERHEIRWKDVDEGRVPMPREGRMLYVLTGKGFDEDREAVVDPYLRWVIYLPYATPESTGIPAEPGDPPWLMYPGTAGAHVMISPPRE